MFFCQPFAADHLKVRILSGGVVLCGEQSPHLHGTDETCGTDLGQLIAGQGMILQIGKPLLAPGSGLFLIVNRYCFAAGDSDGFQVFPAQNRTQTGSACSTFIGNDAGVLHQILTGRADAQPAEFLFADELTEHFLALAGLCSPEVACIVEDELLLVDLQPFAAIALSLQDQGIVAGLFQMETEAAAAVGGSQDSGLGRQSGNVEPGRTGSAGSGEGAGGDHHPVFFGEGGFLTGQMVAENSGSHDFAA